jgi:hypothetical protein
MKMFATMAMPHTTSGPALYRHASHTVHDNVWGRTRIDPLSDLNPGAGGSAARQHWGRQVHRFLSHFTGPIIWAIEITAVLLIIADHSTDFVDAVIVADLVIIVLMMASRATLGLWKESHHSKMLETNMNASLDARPKRAIIVKR